MTRSLDPIGIFLFITQRRRSLFKIVPAQSLHAIAIPLLPNCPHDTESTPLIAMSTWSECMPTPGGCKRKYELNRKKSAEKVNFRVIQGVLLKLRVATSVLVCICIQLIKITARPWDNYSPGVNNCSRPIG